VHPSNPGAVLYCVSYTTFCCQERIKKEYATPSLKTSAKSQAPDFSMLGSENTPVDRPQQAVGIRLEEVDRATASPRIKGKPTGRVGAMIQRLSSPFLTADSKGAPPEEAGPLEAPDITLVRAGATSSPVSQVCRLTPALVGEMESFRGLHVRARRRVDTKMRPQVPTSPRVTQRLDAAQRSSEGTRSSSVAVLARKLSEKAEESIRGVPFSASPAAKTARVHSAAKAGTDGAQPRAAAEPGATRAAGDAAALGDLTQLRMGTLHGGPLARLHGKQQHAVHGALGPAGERAPALAESSATLPARLANRGTTGAVTGSGGLSTAHVGLGIATVRQLSERAVAMAEHVPAGSGGGALARKAGPPDAMAAGEGAPADVHARVHKRTEGSRAASAKARAPAKPGARPGEWLRAGEGDKAGDATNREVEKRSVGRRRALAARLRDLEAARRLAEARVLAEAELHERWRCRAEAVRAEEEERWRRTEAVLRSARREAAARETALPVLEAAVEIERRRRIAEECAVAADAAARSQGRESDAVRARVNSALRHIVWARAGSRASDVLAFLRGAGKRAAAEHDPLWDREVEQVRGLERRLAVAEEEERARQRADKEEAQGRAGDDHNAADRNMVARGTRSDEAGAEGEGGAEFSPGADYTAGNRAHADVGARAAGGAESKVVAEALAEAEVEEKARVEACIKAGDRSLMQAGFLAECKDVSGARAAVAEAVSHFNLAGADRATAVKEVEGSIARAAVALEAEERERACRSQEAAAKARAAEAEAAEEARRAEAEAEVRREEAERVRQEAEAEALARREKMHQLIHRKRERDAARDAARQRESEEVARRVEMERDARWRREEKEEAQRRAAAEREEEELRATEEARWRAEEEAARPGSPPCCLAKAPPRPLPPRRAADTGRAGRRHASEAEAQRRAEEALAQARGAVRPGHSTAAAGSSVRRAPRGAGLSAGAHFQVGGAGEQEQQELPFV
jgi:hypothetical protein